MLFSVLGSTACSTPVFGQTEQVVTLIHGDAAELPQVKRIRVVQFPDYLVGYCVPRDAMIDCLNLSDKVLPEMESIIHRQKIALRLDSLRIEQLEEKIDALGQIEISYRQITNLYEQEITNRQEIQLRLEHLLRRERTWKRVAIGATAALAGYVAVSYALK